MARSLLLLGILLLGACSATVPPPDADPAPTTTTPSVPGSVAEIVDVCDLASAEDFAELGSLDPGRPEMMTSDARGCFWLEDGEPRIIVGVWARHGLDDLDGTPTEINDRAAEQTYDGATCTIGLAGSDTSRVDVLATGDSELTACTIAGRAAEIVEPKLP